MEDVLKPPGSLLATDGSKVVVLVLFLLNVFGVGVSCRKLYSFVVYLYVDQLPLLGKRELICLLLFTCNYVVFVWRGFLFLWVLGMGNVILLWHSLSLPYNYFDLRVHIIVKPESIMSALSQYFLSSLCFASTLYMYLSMIRLHTLMIYL